MTAFWHPFLKLPASCGPATAQEVYDAILAEPEAPYYDTCEDCGELLSDRRHPHNGGSAICEVCDPDDRNAW